MHATEEAGFLPTGEFTQLNSYENRVFDIRLEAEQITSRVIAKFYRPGRWSLQCIQEEHNFLLDLEREGVPVIAPILQRNKSTIGNIAGMYVAFFPKFVGRMPEEFLGNDLYQVGRRLAQIHNVGARQEFKYRPLLGRDPNPDENLDLLQRWIVPEVRGRYQEAAETIIDFVYDRIDPESFIRIHGDCHRGNLLQRKLEGNKNEYFFVDFDDCMMGPESQDFWMLFSGDNFEAERDLILSGYEELRDFPHRQLDLIPALRGLRIFNYAAWIARRWSDPSFPRLFPNFETFTYWAEETEALEKVAWSLED